MAKQTFTTGQVLTAAQMTDLQATAMGGGAASTKTANYVLVSADAGTTVAMNAAGATTITVNTGLFAAGDTVFIQNIGAGVCTITAGTATVNTAGALALPQYDAGILYFTSASAAIFYDYIQVGAASPLTTKGDLYTFSTSDTRLGVGANNTVLTADSAEATGLKWVAPAAGGMTLINSGGTALSGNITTISSIPTTYNDLIIYIVDYYAGSDTNLHLRINSDSTAANYQQFVARGTATSDNSYVTNADAGMDLNGYSIDNVSNDNFATVYIPNYANTVSKKVANSMSGFVNTTPAKAVCNNTTYYSGSTLAITELAFRASDGSNWSAGTVYVYGVK